jgi:Protein of unknown function (DUF1501)
MNLHHAYAQYVTRRHFFRDCAVGLGAIALAELRAHGQEGKNPLAPKKPHHPARAKAVIYLHMAGSPSQLDLFDPKPELVKFNGKPCPKQYLEGKRFAFIRGVPNMLGSPFKFAKHGKSGAELSELWKHLPDVVDDIAIVKSCVTDQFNHAPAQLYLQTGTNLLGGASIGSWATYGLGTENQNLPGFVVLTSGGKQPDAGKSVWGSGFLPGVYQGVQCRSPGDPVLFLSDPPGLDRNGRRQTLDALAKLNQMQAEALGDPETVTRIQQYELAYRMQMEAPKVMDISKEPKEVIEMYGAVPGYVSPADGAVDPRTLYKGTDPTIANNCLLARRLVQAGVRYVQIYDWGWDHHGVSAGEDITHTLPIKTQQVDRALTGLIKDLKRLGLFDSTLVIWGGEFGRTPMAQNSPNQTFVGRDHHPYAFTTLMAGGGIKGGQTYGKTDDIGYYVAEDAFDVRDLQATVLHLLGLDPFKLTFEDRGLAQRLIGVEGKAKLHAKLLA